MVTCRFAVIVSSGSLFSFSVSTLGVMPQMDGVVAEVGRVVSVESVDHRVSSLTVVGFLCISEVGFGVVLRIGKFASL